METLSRTLRPYKLTVGNVAGIVTTIQFFSGSVICFDIFKKKTTQGVSSMPFIGGTVIGILVLKYAIMLNDQAMYQVNMAAIILNVMYLIFYLVYSKHRYEEVYRPSARGFALVSALFLYIKWEDATKIEFRYGLIVTVLMLLLMGSPLMEIKDIIRKKDASCIPFPITFMAFFVSILWLLYGIILMNDFMIIQNTIGTLLCVTQLYLCFKYAGDKKSHKE
ncbi:sugar transporter SWEET1 [Onthophagus taurus]|uniref:sugar transporter SWEET1 n=1 Tax=Onthophagus taurus TaxID=166361 RepID=UPI000C20CBEA|nr:sugar transporter SWEET1 [Onthophagus taurus]XP_022918000.1 sugar transporter SWEET1 [Onthophagus taurus]